MLLNPEGTTMSAFRFDGFRAVVTGGGTGIGRATALALAEQGAKTVYAVGRRPEPLEKTAAGHGAIVPVTADLRTDAGAAAVEEAVRAGSGRLDLLVHNAGVWHQTALADLAMEDVQDVFETNVLAPVRLTARLLPLLASPGASLVLVSSVMGHLPGPGQSGYAASKAALDSLTRSWAKELAPLGIRVNAIAPGAVETEALSPAALGVTEEQFNLVKAKKAKLFPLGRYGRLEDVTRWITHLADPAASWLTGQVLTVDGGWDLGAPAAATTTEGIVTS